MPSLRFSYCFHADISSGVTRDKHCHAESMLKAWCGSDHIPLDRLDALIERVVNELCATFTVKKDPPILDFPDSGVRYDFDFDLFRDETTDDSILLASVLSLVCHCTTLLLLPCFLPTHRHHVPESRSTNASPLHSNSYRRYHDRHQTSRASLASHKWGTRSTPGPLRS